MNETMQIRTIAGTVVSNKMDKTIAVLVERKIKHQRYGKYVKKSTKLLAHDEENICNEGDKVLITSCRPISKNKTFKLVKKVTNTD